MWHSQQALLHIVLHNQVKHLVELAGTSFFIHAENQHKCVWRSLLVCVRVHFSILQLATSATWAGFIVWMTSWVAWVVSLWLNLWWQRLGLNHIIVIMFHPNFSLTRVACNVADHPALRHPALRDLSLSSSNTSTLRHSSPSITSAVSALRNSKPQCVCSARGNRPRCCSDVNPRQVLHLILTRASASHGCYLWLYSKQANTAMCDSPIGCHWFLQGSGSGCNSVTELHTPNSPQHCCLYFHLYDLFGFGVLSVAFQKKHMRPAGGRTSPTWKSQRKAL